MMVKKNVVKEDIREEIKMEKSAAVELFQPKAKKDKDDKPSKV